jgi:Transposase, Mutator family
VANCSAWTAESSLSHDRPRRVCFDGRRENTAWHQSVASSAAGSTRPRTCSPSCRRASSPKPNARCRRYGWPKPKAIAELTLDAFIESYALKYAKAADCLSQDGDALLAFYDLPAEHWKHLRTTNPIESTFATVRHRTIRSNSFSV